jgi:hypothetical protein
VPFSVVYCTEWTAGAVWSGATQVARWFQRDIISDATCAQGDGSAPAEKSGNDEDKTCCVETARGEVIDCEAGVAAKHIVESVRSMYLINGGGLYRDGKPLADDDILEAGVRYVFGGGIITCKDFLCNACMLLTRSNFTLALKPSRDVIGWCASLLQLSAALLQRTVPAVYHSEVTACAVWSGVTQIAEWFQRGPANDTSPRAAEATRQRWVAIKTPIKHG